MATTEEKTMFEQRRAAIKGMPPGEERDQAMADLSKDYPTLMKMAEGELARAEGALDDAMDMPKSRVAGSSSNPFAVEIAPDVTQYMAKGLRGYQANKDRKDAMGSMGDMAEGKQRATSAMMEAGLGGPEEQAAQASALRQPMGAHMGGGDMNMMTEGGGSGFGDLGMTEEERRKLKMAAMGI
jgi:hypothetical protein